MTSATPQSPFGSERTGYAMSHDCAISTQLHEPYTVRVRILGHPFSAYCLSRLAARFFRERDLSRIGRNR